MLPQGNGVCEELLVINRFPSSVWSAMAVLTVLPSNITNYMNIIDDLKSWIWFALAASSVVPIIFPLPPMWFPTTTITSLSVSSSWSSSPLLVVSSWLNHQIILSSSTLSLFPPETVRSLCRSYAALFIRSLLSLAIPGLPPCFLAAEPKSL